MSFIGKEYKLDRQVDFDKFVDTFGSEVPDDFKKALIAHKPTTKLEKSGDTYTLTNSEPKGTNVVTFKSGVEFDEKLGGKANSKTTITLNGTILTTVQKVEDGVVFTTKREFKDNELIVTITSSRWDGSATRYFKAV